MNIKYNGSIAILTQGVQKANELLSSDAFYAAIAQKHSFSFSTATGAQVAASIRKCNLELTVKTFKKILSRELGYEDPGNPTTININIAGNKLDRSLGSIVGTFIHEAVHAADADDDVLDYHHNGNLAKGNGDTAPYWIGNLAAQMIDNPQQVGITPAPEVAHAPQDKMALLSEATEAAKASPQALATNFGLKVTVLNAEGPPLDINISLQKFDGSAPAITYSQPGSFSKTEILATGRYKLIIDGTNTEGGSTEADIDGDFSTAPIPGQHSSSSAKSYLMYFFFDIA